MNKLLIVTGITGITSFVGLRLGLFGPNNNLKVPNECDHVHFRSSIFYDRYIMRDEKENPLFFAKQYNYDQGYIEIKTDTIFSFRPVVFIVNKHTFCPVKIVDKN